MRPRRLPQQTYIGIQAYFLTICAADRHTVFAQETCAHIARDHLLRTGADYAFAVIAYCIMPDHLHALVEGLGEDSDFKRFVSMFKQRSAFEYRREGGGALWQSGYYEHVMRSDQSYPSVVAYILNNPIRAGL